MSGVSPNYGYKTICRPLVSNIKTFPKAKQVDCPYCGRACWKLDIEPDPPPLDTTVACTECAFRRSYMQQEMDTERWKKEYPEASCQNPSV